jgi:hypothetical protein
MNAAEAAPELVAIAEADHVLALRSGCGQCGQDE